MLARVDLPAEAHLAELEPLWPSASPLTGRPALDASICLGRERLTSGSRAFGLFSHPEGDSLRWDHLVEPARPNYSHRLLRPAAGAPLVQLKPQVLQCHPPPARRPVYCPCTSRSMVTSSQVRRPREQRNIPTAMAAADLEALATTAAGAAQLLPRPASAQCCPSRLMPTSERTPPCPTLQARPMGQELACS